MISKKILIVEDDEPIRAMMGSVLELEGYSVSAASNGEQAIRVLQNGYSPDLILLDMMMPVMNGWDFLDFMRTRATTARIPVIVVSAYTEIAKSVKPQAVVSKPVQLNTLLSAIQKFAA